MIFTIEGEAFQAALKQVGTVVPAKSPIPLMSSVKIVTRDGCIVLTATDMDRAIEVECAAEVEVDGDGCIAFSTLAQFVGAARKKSVRLSAEGGTAKLSAGRSRISLHVLDTADFPSIEVEEMSLATIAAADLSRVLRFGLAAASTKEVQWHLCGVRVAEHDGNTHIVGTDGGSMHMVEMVGRPDIGTGTVPTAAVDAILKLCPKDGPVMFGVQPNGWRFESEGVRIWGRCIDGAFVDYMRMIGNMGETSAIAEADAMDLRDALTVAAIGAETDGNKSRDIAVLAKPGGALVLRGRAGANGVVHAGRAEIEGAGLAEFSAGYSGKMLERGFDGIPDGQASLVVNGQGILQVAPTQEDATIRMRVIVSAMRFTQQELADVA